MGCNPNMPGDLKRRGQDADTHRGTATWGHGEKVAICTPRREAAEDEPCPHLALGPPASEV